MNPKRFVIGTVVGGTTIFVTGLLLFSLPPLTGFYFDAMNAGSASGVPRESPLVWAIFLGALSYGALVTLAIGSRNEPTAITTGIRIGAIVGFLLWFTANFMFFGISNVGNLTTTMLDPLVELVPGAVAGGLVAAVIRGGSTDRVLRGSGRVRA